MTISVETLLLSRVIAKMDRDSVFRKLVIGRCHSQTTRCGVYAFEYRGEIGTSQKCLADL
jgi:hypothetical protein